MKLVRFLVALVLLIVSYALAYYFVDKIVLGGQWPETSKRWLAFVFVVPFLMTVVFWAVALVALRYLFPPEHERGTASADAQWTLQDILNTVARIESRLAEAPATRPEPLPAECDPMVLVDSLDDVGATEEKPPPETQERY